MNQGQGQGQPVTTAGRTGNSDVPNNMIVESYY